MGLGERGPRPLKESPYARLVAYIIGHSFSFGLLHISGEIFFVFGKSLLEKNAAGENIYRL